MFPVIAIVGRPNVGKSTLFNYLTRSRAALVADEPNMTRDRQYGEGFFKNQRFIAIDTGGLEYFPDTPNKPTQQGSDKIQEKISQQTWTAISEADIIFWVTDARAGLTTLDQAFAKKLRTLTKPVYLAVNKSDGLDANLACADFYATGIKQIFAIAATQGNGVNTLLQNVFLHSSVDTEISTNPAEPAQALHGSEASAAIKVAIVGRPNVGKSTLINRILGEERVIVYDAPGTTRDSIFIPFERRSKKYILIDTAGVRRRRSIENPVEKFSVVKTLQAITESNVTVFVIDAKEGLADQDLHLLGYILESGRALVIAVNKWDGLAIHQREWVRKELDRRLTFVRYASLHFISALHGSGVGNLFASIHQAYHSATRKLSTHKLTDILERAVKDHQPPAIAGRRIKLRYAHAGGSNPPIIVIHGNQTQDLPLSYHRYLANYFRDTLALKGTPVHIELCNSENPYKDKKNTLTPRQTKRRQRLIKHVKKKS